MERFDLYDPRRRPLGRTIAKGEDMPEGCRRLIVHFSLSSIGKGAVYRPC